MWILTLLLAAAPGDERPTFVGPTLDPLDGSTVLQLDREWLPQTRQLANLADFWFIEVVNMQNSGGGIATFDPQYTASHGRSRTLTGHYWNGANVTDPARPGEPLMQLPYFAWDAIRYESLSSTEPGFHLRFDPTQESVAWARGSAGANVGGPLFIPAGFMDREPSFPFGASPTVRELDRASELEAQVAVSGEVGALRLLAERLDHTRQFPTFVDPTTGRLLDDDSSRDTVMGIGRLDALPVPVELMVAFQSSERTHEDSQFRLPLAYTHAAESRSWIANLRSQAEVAPGWTLEGGLGFGAKNESLDRVGDEPLVRDLLEEWLWLARPRTGGAIDRQLWDAHATLRNNDEEWPLSLSARVSQGDVTSRPDLDPVSGTSYLRGGGDVGVAIDVYDPARESREWIRNGRLQADGEWRPGGGWSFRYFAGLDYSAVGNPGTRHLSLLTPGLGAAAEYRADNGSSWYFLLRREPDPLTFEQARFLSTTRPSGERYRWLDDGDGIPEPGEEGALLERFGGPYHRVRGDIERPTSNLFSFGWRSPQFGAFQATLTGIARFHMNPMTVRLEGPAAESYTRRVVEDPGGDGRGEGRTDGGAGFTPVFDRSPGTNGRELYALTNRERENLYIGAEIQLATIERDWWFLNLQAKGYWNIGSATFGVFPDRNDPGILDENSANPNQRINQRGRFDQDRSFGVKLMTGIEPIDNLRSSLSLRYRDGQPFTRMLVLDAADGTGGTGEVPIMAVWRGAPRHTFHMSIDGRIRYDLDLGVGQMALIADGFNLLGSTTELLEDPRQGDTFRRALEAVPGRAFLLSVELAI